MRSLPNVAPKPRILICAPSNAAADELLQRIMTDGFHDVQVHHLHMITSATALEYSIQTLCVAILQHKWQRGKQQVWDLKTSIEHATPPSRHLTPAIEASLCLAGAGQALPAKCGSHRV